MDPRGPVAAALMTHPSVRSVRLVGSRANGSGDPLSDWDFKIDAADLAGVRSAIRTLIAPLCPVLQQWDAVSSEWIYMFILPDMTKVELFLGPGHRPEAPWTITEESLTRVDAHFWDWILFIETARARGKSEAVTEHLGLIHVNILRPLGIRRVPKNADDAVTGYKRAREDWEGRFGMRISRTPETEIGQFLQRVRARADP